jgi:hypothetical protein
MSRLFPTLSVAAVVEERIQEGMRRGDFDDLLPGAGKPLDLDDDALVPPELRIAYRILRNAGVVPPEVIERREIAELEVAVAGLDDDERRRALARLAVLRTRLGARRARCLSRNACYERKIVERLAGG